jgi:hypothetical protein
MTQRYELSKQLQDLHVDVSLFSETYLKPHERIFISNYHFYRTDSHPGLKGGLAVAVRRRSPYNNIDLSSPFSAEATGFCIPIGNSGLLLASAYKPAGRAWINADITNLLSFRRKSILAGDHNAKQLFWNLSGDKLMALFDLGEFEISALQCSTHYSPARNGDVQDIVVHQNTRMSDVTVSNILDSYHLPIIFHILDHVKIRNLSERIKKFTDWDKF